MDLSIRWREHLTAVIAATVAIASTSVASAATIRDLGSGPVAPVLTRPAASVPGAEIGLPSDFIAHGDVPEKVRFADGLSNDLRDFIPSAPKNVNPVFDPIRDTGVKPDRPGEKPNWPDGGKPTDDPGSRVPGPTGLALLALTAIGGAGRRRRG